jgi:hypothetical protein
MANVGIPKSFDSEAATSSCVLNGFDAHRTTLAPAALRVRIRLAVSAVTCRHAETFIPLSGFCLANRSRIAARTGMSLSAHRILLFPSDANDKSATSYFIHNSFQKSG